MEIPHGYEIVSKSGAVETGWMGEDPLHPAFTKKSAEKYIRKQIGEGFFSDPRKNWKIRLLPDAQYVE